INITTNSFLCVGCKKPRKKRSKFCSVECYWTTLKRKYETKCQICGKKYWTFPSHQKKFCTRKCAYQFISENYRGSKSRAGWKGGKISRSCIQCKKNFYRFPAQINKKPCKFCSRLCYDKWVKEGKRKKSLARATKWFSSLYGHISEKVGFLQEGLGTLRYRERNEGKVETSTITMLNFLTKTKAL